MTTLAIDVPQRGLADFCRRNHIQRLSLFGSVLRDDFGPESDIDVLVEFDPQHIPGLIGLAGMEIELSQIFGGRKVDLNTPGFFQPELRRKISRQAVVQYES